MKLEKNAHVITVKGNIASLSDFEMIKTSLEEMRTQHEKIILKIPDSLIINSSLIGYLVKIVKRDGITINLLAGNDILYELLDDLGLTETLNLQKI